jgi:hypothetical protein
MINTQLDQPQARRVTFSTPNHAIFYMELSMDKTEFIQLHDFIPVQDENPDDIIANTNAADAEPVEVLTAADVDDDFLNNLGL